MSREEASEEGERSAIHSSDNTEVPSLPEIQESNAATLRDMATHGRSFFGFASASSCPGAGEERIIECSWRRWQSLCGRRMTRRAPAGDGVLTRHRGPRVKIGLGLVSPPRLVWSAPGHRRTTVVFHTECLRTAGAFLLKRRTMRKPMPERASIVTLRRSTSAIPLLGGPRYALPGPGLVSEFHAVI